MPYTQEQIHDIAQALYGWTALPRILPSAPGTGPDWDLGADIRTILAALKDAENSRANAFGLLASIGIPKSRAGTVTNGIMVYEGRMKREINTLTARAERAEAYAAKLEKVGDGIRNYKPDSNPLQAETDIEELFDKWDAVRKEKP